jgi:DNA topoisomerase I
MLLLTEEINLNNRQLKAIINDPEKTASAVNLVYVNDQLPGIRRVKRGKSFIYLDGKKSLRDKKLLLRIQSLVIPPAWENVWICKLENGHLQATGLDIKRRKQYRYHPLWNTLRNHTKFYRLYAFGKTIPRVRARLEKDLSLKGLPPDKVLAAVVCLMERTSIRIGNDLYEKLYGSFGLTTLKDEHVRISGHHMRFMFRGKKGVFQNISIKSARLARIVKACRDIPGKELFQYVDETGEYRCIDSGMVNDYIREISGGDFSAKDFRTWAGSVQALIAFREIGPWKTTKEMKSNIVRALDNVAAHLGNTRTVCKKYYVHPLVIQLYEGGKLWLYADNFDDRCEPGDLACEEKLLLHILEKESAAISL